MTVQSLNHSYNFIQSFKLSVFHSTILNLWGHGAIFTCHCSNLLKKCYYWCRTRKLPHVQKLYFGNFYRAFKKSNNYLAAMIIPVISLPLTLILLRHSWAAQSFLLGKSIFAFKRLVNLLQVSALAFPCLLFYLWFWWTSSWLTIIQKLGSGNQQKRSHWPWTLCEILTKHHKETRFECQHHLLTMLKTICNANDVLTAIFVQCRPGSHMLSLIC